MWGVKMSKDYYNILLLKKITCIKERNPEKAKVELEGYLAMYPIDFYAWSIYVGVLVSLQSLDDALKYLKLTEYNIHKKDFSIQKHYFDERNFEEYLFYIRAKVLSYTGRYDELWREFINNSKIGSIKNIDFLKLYCEKKLGILKLKRSIDNCYIINQIIDYNEADMREHINKHLSYYNSFEFLSSSVFSSDFPIDDMILEIKKYMPSCDKYLYGLYDDSYYFKYDYCGKVDGKFTNYFRVVCFENSSNIITMCPAVVDENVKHVDLNYLKDEKVTVKRISQIDKFNRRYKR